MYYTYLYLRQDATPYYVGKGCGKRALEKFNRFAATPTTPDGITDKTRILIQHWPDESTAFEMEKYYIRLFGRKDQLTGILRNLTDGGDGASGAIRSATTRRRMSLSNNAVESGQLDNARLPFTDEHQRKAGKLGGRVAVESGQLGAIRSTGGRTSAHLRWHVARNIINSACALCTASL